MILYFWQENAHTVRLPQYLKRYQSLGYRLGPPCNYRGEPQDPATSPMFYGLVGVYRADPGVEPISKAQHQLALWNQ